MNRHTHKVKSIFSSISVHYDRANKFISLGMDGLWRKKLVRWSKASSQAHILDCGTGTGALACEFQKQLGSQVKITAVDFCEQMLKQSHKHSQIHYQLADVQNLPFEDNTFDVSAMAYGLRNMENSTVALTEMARVTKPRGKVLILETGEPVFFLKFFFNIYFQYIVPFLGGLITGRKTAYQYLQSSSRKFPSRKKMINIMKQTNCFSDLEYKTLFFGASFIYKATVVSF